MTGNTPPLEVRGSDSRMCRRRWHGAAVLLLVLCVSACEPGDRRPGLWLHGEVVTPLPDDWSFTDEYKEIFVEVHTPYLIPHSVTIWCGQVDGELYIGARDPDTKHWPRWLEQNHDIRLKIGDKIYEAAAADISSDGTLNAVRAAYAKKYDLPRTAAGSVANVKYWTVVPRGST